MILRVKNYMTLASCVPDTFFQVFIPVNIFTYSLKIKHKYSSSLELRTGVCVFLVNRNEWTDKTDTQYTRLEFSVPIDTGS